jgi:hypothetical protein
MEKEMARAKLRRDCGWHWGKEENAFAGFSESGLKTAVVEQKHAG